MQQLRETPQMYSSAQYLPLFSVSRHGSAKCHGGSLGGCPITLRSRPREPPWFVVDWPCRKPAGCKQRHGGPCEVAIEAPIEKRCARCLASQASRWLGGRACFPRVAGFSASSPRCSLVDDALHVLEASGLVRSEKLGRVRTCSFSRSPPPASSGPPTSTRSARSWPPPPAPPGPICLGGSDASSRPHASATGNPVTPAPPSHQMRPTGAGRVHGRADIEAYFQITAETWGEFRILAEDLRTR